MQRRELLKLLALGSALPVIPSPLLAACRKVHASMTESPSLKVLTPQEDATVTAMADLLIPRTETPGAKDTKVNLFIDRIVADWYSDEERAVFLAGLKDIDRRTLAMFQSSFVDASAAQQTEILRSLGDELAQAVGALANHVRGHRGATPEPENNFYLQFRSLALTGYFTSEAGFTQQLHKEIVPGRFDGCAPVESAPESRGS